MIKRCLTSLFATLIVCFLACSSASARVCFLPDSTDCGEGEGKGGIVGSGNVEVPCQYSSCPAYNPKYQECYDERTYNNGGVNVECKQVRCKLSKSACEEQEDNPNSTQCCNLDSASGCYYMGKCPVLCNRNIYDSTTALPEEDYNCPSCKDKNGTFYNCTAIEKGCKDIKPVNTYTDKCSDSQTPVIAEGIKDSQGNQCYTCNDKPVEKKECKDIKPVNTYTNKCDDSQTPVIAKGIKDSQGNQCYTCKDKPVEKNCSDIKKFYKNINQVSQCENYEPVKGVSAADGQCYKCTIGNCFGKESKIYYVTYGTYLQGNVAYQPTCQCSSYLVKGNSPNSRPIKTTAISTPGGGSSSTEKIELPTILTGVSSSNPYSVRIEEYGCFGDDHCSAQAVKFDVFEKYAPDTAKSLKEDDYFFNGDGVATTFKESLYFYTGRQLKPKSISINTCDDYVVILGRGNPKTCTQINNDYYNYIEACPKGLEKKIVPNEYDGTFAQCYTCEKPVEKKECKDIKPVNTYTDKCSDSQTPVIAEGIKDSNNKQCYTCKDNKPVETTCHIEEVSPWQENCKYELNLGSSTIPSKGIDKKAGTSVRVWAYARGSSTISDIRGANGNFQQDSNSGYKDFDCEAGETYKLYATCRF